MSKTDDKDTDMQKADFCTICKDPITNTNFYNIYRVMVFTNKDIYYIGLEKVIHELADFVMKAGYHLSATQIILLRPDVFKVYLQKKFNPDTVQFWFLQEHEVCYECFEEYKEMMPLK